MRQPQCPHSGASCTEAHSTLSNDGDYLVAVVADGAGSVSGTSAWGAYTACQSVLSAASTTRFINGVRRAAPNDSQELMRWLFDGALEKVNRRAEQMALSPAQLSTTLCIAVARPGLTVFGQIGDGIIAIDADETVSTVLIEDKQDYANTTWFLQSQNAFTASFRVSVQTGVDAFALSTDGMSYKITNITTGEAYAPFFRSAWDNVRGGGSAADFTAMLRDIKDDQTGDDKTMVLAALQWQPDLFHPSARPVHRTTVSSPPPPAVGDDAGGEPSRKRRARATTSRKR